MRCHRSGRVRRGPQACTGARRRGRGQAGLSLIEVLVTIVLMASIAASLSTLVGAAIRSKLIVAARSADTQTARQMLEWISERLRNAGLNVMPTDAVQATYPARCKDRVVAQETSLLPTATRVYVAGEILNTDTTAGNEIDTLGYYLDAGSQAIIEDRNRCPSGPQTIASLTDPRVRVTSLSFRYFQASGAEVTDLTSATEIRRIQMIRITMTVEGSQGSSGTQAQTFARDVMLRNPEPYANDWKNPNEVNP